MKRSKLFTFGAAFFSVSLLIGCSQIEPAPKTKYAATFYHEDATSVFYTQQVEENKKINVAEIPSTDIVGKSFKGWFTTSAKTEAFNFDAAITANTSIFGKWDNSVYNIIYKDMGGGDFSGSHESGYPTTHTYGTATSLKTASKSEFSFDGWFTTSDCSGTAITTLGATAYTQDITLYAKWTGITYNIGKTSDVNYTINCAKSSAASGESVSFTVSPVGEAIITGVSVVDTKSNPVSVTESSGTYSFQMPSSAVTISALYYVGFDDNNVVVRAPLFSDEHCERTSPIDSSAQTTASIQKFTNLVGRNTFDVWLSAGDRSLTGTTTADEAWYNAYTSGCSDAGSKLFFAHGNHDVYWTGCASRAEHYNYFNSKGVYAMDSTSSDPTNGNRHAVINGVNFMTIDITTYNGTTNPINDTTKTWAKGVLDAIDSTKPVFVLSHCTAPNTMLGSNDDEADGYWGSSADLYDIVKDYPNVILLSGHTHYDSHSERNIFQDKFTAINVPTLAGGNQYDTYFNGVFDRLYDIDDDGNKKYKASGVIDGLAEDATKYTASQGMYLEVDSHNNTRITRYDLKNSVQIGQPWIISAPKANGAHLEKYNTYNRLMDDEGLYFDGSASYTDASGEVTVSFDSFKHYGNDLAYAYELQIFDGKTEAQLDDQTVPTNRKVIYANWYTNATYASDTYSYTFSGTHTGTYTVRVIGFDSLGRYTIVYPTAK